MAIIVVKTPRCIECGKTGEVAVHRDSYFAWKNGALIQEVMPELSSDKREMLMTGTHPECWTKMFN